MVRGKYGVRLTSEQRNELQHLVRAGKGSARVIIRARILLKTDEGWSAPRVAEALEVAEGTVFRIKRRFAEGGWTGFSKTYPKPIGTGSWTTVAKRTSLRWPAPNRRKGMNTGPCAFWRARWWSWGWCPPYPTRRCGCT